MDRWPLATTVCTAASPFAQPIAALSPSALLVADPLGTGRVRQATATADAAAAGLEWIDTAMPATPALETLVARHGLVVTADATGTSRLMARDSDVVTTVALPDEAVRDADWTGVEIAAGGRTVWLARRLQRALATIDVGTATAATTTYLLHAPHALAQIAPQTQRFGPDLVVVAEGPALAVWDARTPAIAQRTRALPRDTLMAVASSETHVAVAGAERAVAVFDPRKWGVPIMTWTNALKYEVTWLRFAASAATSSSPATGLTLFAASKTDSELSIGPSSNGRNISTATSRLRVDARWIGLDGSCTDDGSEEVLWGQTAAGTVIRVRDAVRHLSVHTAINMDDDDEPQVKRQAIIAD